MKYRDIREVKSDCVPPGEKGVVLLVMTWVIALISVVILGWMEEWRTEIKLAANYYNQRKCHYLAQGGIYYALGKLVEAKIVERKRLITAARTSPNLWRTDQTPYILEFLEGRVEISMADEGGKLNLNQLPKNILAKFLEGLGFKDHELQSLLSAIPDRRDAGAVVRPLGVAKNFNLSLLSPFFTSNRKFETIEELALVHGLRDTHLLSRLSRWFTVQETGAGVNINTAPREVLKALGFSTKQAEAVILARRGKPFESLNEVALTGMVIPLQVKSHITFQTSNFFTITSTGTLKNKSGRHTIKTLLEFSGRRTLSWKFLYWMDDYPA